MDPAVAAAGIRQGQFFIKSSNEEYEIISEWSSARMSVINTINPATEEVIASYPLMHKNEVEKIIVNMHEAQQSWSHSSIGLRIHCLQNTARLLLKNKTHYATLITHEMGKPIIQAIGEIEKCARLCEYYAAEGEQFLKPELIQTHYHKSYRSFHPLGIIFAIMPWNLGNSKA